MSMKMIRLPTAARHAFLALLLMGVMLSFGAGYAYSGLKSAHKDMIRWLIPMATKMLWSIHSSLSKARSQN